MVLQYADSHLFDVPVDIYDGGGGGGYGFSLRGESFFPPDRGRDFREFIFHYSRRGNFFHQTGGEIFFSRIPETILFSKAIKAEQ